MPAGNLTIDISFTTDIDTTSAYLRWFGTNAGAVKQGGPGDDYAYMVILPHNFGTETAVEEDVEEEDPEEETEGFRIFAQAENPAAGLTLQEGNPPDGGDNLLNKPLTITEGLHKYTITVTPQDENSDPKTYYIKVIKVPDLSLQTFKIKGSAGYERDLAPLDTQKVYIHIKDNLEIEKTATYAGATVSQSPNSIPALSVDGDPTVVTVTVSKDDLGNEVPDEYKKKNYTLNLYYVAGADLEPMADGGIISFIPGNANSFYEVHTFLAPAGGKQTTTTQEQIAGTLTFTTKPADNKVEVLVVAGGGGGGKGTTAYVPAGGGAGGYIYHDAYDIGGDASAFAVKVGLGGEAPTETGYGNKAAGTIGATCGSNGGNSQFGADDSDKRIEAYGGGGGSSHAAATATSGADGGSGGGGVYNPNEGGDAYPGVAPEGATLAGYKGGGHYKGAGGGAGGAGGAATGANNTTSALGGIGVSSDISGETRWYAGGGAAGNVATNPEAYGANGDENGAPGTGDGGGSNGAGGSGIVIVRFLHSEAE